MQNMCVFIDYYGMMTDQTLEDFILTIPVQKCASQQANRLYVMLSQMVKQISTLDLSFQVEE